MTGLRKESGAKARHAGREHKEPQDAHGAPRISVGESLCLPREAALAVVADGDDGHVVGRPDATDVAMAAGTGERALDDGHAGEVVLVHAGHE